ncbi:MAG: (2Fe-2S) ferredoxin domain-containing protein [Pseudomonadota bacterium]|nr:(2Fe-2S) ferredoxin domain-containing protein [Pseudomonadota bacterium]
MKTEIRANWSHAILVCKKCSKKQSKKGCGFGPEQKRLSAALKRDLGAGKGRKAPVGVIEVSCLDICPKKGVVVIDSRTPEKWRIITPEDDFDEQIAPLR